MDSLDTCIVTFNCARKPVNPPLFAGHLANTLPQDHSHPSLIVLSLQEVAPIAYSFLGASYLTAYLNQFHHAIDLFSTKFEAPTYVNILTRNLGLTAIMVFVRADVASRIQWLEEAGVGFGLSGMGNKGAVGLRMGYQVGEETMEMTFVAAHLAPMEEELDRRNEDWKSIVKGLVFTPVSGTDAGKADSPQRPSRDDEDRPLLSDPTNEPSGIYKPTSHLFLAGDLNYRTSLTKPSPHDYKTFPKPSKDSQHPKHYIKLLQSDQLTRELESQKTCHGFKEPPIEFPPTYKYSATADIDDLEWHWAKHRWPSWCDRILYLDLPPWMKQTTSQPSASIEIHKYTALPLLSSSDHRAVMLSLSIPLKAIPPPTDEDNDDVRLHPPFELDERWREKRKMARRREFVVGVLAYLALTWEGRGVLVAVSVGIVGSWLVARAFLEL